MGSKGQRPQCLSLRAAQQIECGKLGEPKQVRQGRLWGIVGHSLHPAVHELRRASYVVVEIRIVGQCTRRRITKRLRLLRAAMPLVSLPIRIVDQPEAFLGAV